ncbi:hypothetical protein [Povalibacter sp.]|uniref:hypothetical protein n=1 Tax=Povalibacter sp. TaxID=1962978 RepID=UPI002F3EC7EC
MQPATAIVRGYFLGQQSLSPALPVMRGISIKAIVLATLAVFGIDIVSGILVTVMFSPSLWSLPEDQLQLAIDVLNANPSYLASTLFLGTASTVIGGYLTARMANQVPYFNAAGFGLVGLLLGVPLTGDLPFWFRALGLGLTLPAALLGAYLSKRQGR